MLPHALSLATLLACSRPGGPPEVHGDPDHDWPVLDALDEAIVDRMTRDRIAGLAACIVVDGATAWCSGYGEANPDTGLPALPSTPFLLASVSKAVTAVAALQAVADGHLALDGAVDGVLPFDLVHPDSPGREISLRHLMTHTSGIADNWDVLEPHIVEGDSTLALGDFLQGYLVAGGDDYDDLDNFLPEGVGGAHEYSNVGAALVGYAVEASTGVPFDDYSDARIFEPLGMNAGWHLADFDADLVAAPSLVQGGAFVTLPHFGFPDYPDGQLRADAHAMARFVGAVSKGGTLDGVTLLDAPLVEAMLEPQVPELEPDQGLLWYRWTLDGETVVGHNGGEEGTSTEILIRPSDGLGLVVLMNSEGKGRTLEHVERAMVEAAEGL